MKYLWTEDIGAGLHFWKLINQLFFENAFVVESKESNQGILDALTVLKLENDDEYYIAFDYVVDNQDIGCIESCMVECVLESYLYRLGTDSFTFSEGRG